MDMAGKAAAVVLLVAVLILAVLAGGCGESGRNNGSPTVTSSPVKTPGDDSAPGGEAVVDVFFIKGESAFPVSRTVDRAGPEAALRKLLEGPDEEEVREGIGTAIPEGTRLISYSASGGKALADFSGELRSYGGGAAMVEAITRQIDETITSNDQSISSVEITVEGVSAEEALQP
jgi:spore germination protein GerM